MRVTRSPVDRPSVVPVACTADLLPANPDPYGLLMNDNLESRWN
jgi:hypothetical protein